MFYRTEKYLNDYFADIFETPSLYAVSHRYIYLCQKTNKNCTHTNLKIGHEPIFKQCERKNIVKLYNVF